MHTDSVRTGEDDTTDTLRTYVRAVGGRRLASSIAVGIMSLVASIAGGAAGAWVALERSNFELGPPDSLFANAIVVIGATLVAALGGIIGFYAAVTTLPPLAVWLLGWPRPLPTALNIAAIEIVATPVIVLAVGWLMDGPVADALIPTSVLLLGGVGPGLARWLATARPPEPAAET